MILQTCPQPQFKLCKCLMRVIFVDFQILWIWKKSVAFATLKFEFECSP